MTVTPARAGLDELDALLGESRRLAAAEIIAGFPKAFRTWHAGNHAAWQEAERKADAVLALAARSGGAQDDGLRGRIEALAKEYERRAALNADPTTLDSRVHQMAAARLRAALDEALGGGKL